MDGRVLDLAVPAGPHDREPELLASYGPAAKPGEVSEIDPEDLEQHEEYLKALGYLD